MKRTLKERYERNISLFKIIACLTWGRFVVPILALFYIASQVTYEEFAIIMGVFSLSILLLEIPTGALSDLMGRKNSLLLSRFLYTVEVAILAFGNGFELLLLAKIISGIGVSFASGTNSAMIYETLQKLKREKEHKKITGEMGVITSISMAFVFIIGAFLFSLSPKLPALASIPFQAASFFFTLFLIEPKISHKNITLKSSWKQMVDGITYFRKNKFVIYLTLLTVFVGASVSVSLSISSVYFDLILIPIGLIGVVQFIGSMLMAYGSKHADVFEKKYGEQKSFYSLIQFIMISTVTMGLLVPYIGLLFYLLIPLASSTFGILINNAMQDHVNNTHRATILSVQNMFGQLAVFLLFPLVGFLQSTHFSLGYIAMFIIMLLFAVIAQRYANKNKIQLSL